MESRLFTRGVDVLDFLEKALEASGAMKKTLSGVTMRRLHVRSQPFHKREKCVVGLESVLYSTND